MSETYSVVMGDRGRVVVPAELRERAAALWRRGSGLSLADRLCLATAHRLSAVVWTADTAWGTGEPVRQVLTKWRRRTGIEPA